MIIPFEQMAKDHLADARTMHDLQVDRMHESVGVHMWAMATYGIGWYESQAITRFEELDAKYPHVRKQWP